MQACAISNGSEWQGQYNGSYQKRTQPPNTYECDQQPFKWDKVSLRVVHRRLWSLDPSIHETGEAYAQLSKIHEATA